MKHPVHFNILFQGIDNAKEPIIKVPSWEVGAFCRGVFKEDGLEYEGQITFKIFCANWTKPYLLEIIILDF